MNAIQRIEALQNKQCGIAYKEVERLARKILKKNPELEGFCMAMGGATFYQKEGWHGDENTGEYHDRVVDDKDPRITEMVKFINAVGDMTKVYGLPMKIDRWDDPIITDW
jgi:hypothetical protein